VQAGDGVRLEIFIRAGGRDVSHIGVLGLKRPANKRREAPGFILQLTKSFEVLDSLGKRLDVAEHRRCSAAATQLVPDAIDVEPVVGHYLTARDRAANAIDQNLCAASRQTAQTGVF